MRIPRLDQVQAVWGGAAIRALRKGEPIKKGFKGIYKKV